MVWENVPGILSDDGGRTFGTCLGLLGDCGYGFAYRVLTLNTSVFPSDATVSYLSAIVETGDHLRPYCLSATASQGILRRAAKRGRRCRLAYTGR